YLHLSVPIILRSKAIHPTKTPPPSPSLGSSGCIFLVSAEAGHPPRRSPRNRSIRHGGSDDVVSTGYYLFHPLSFEHQAMSGENPGCPLGPGARDGFIRA